MNLAEFRIYADEIAEEIKLRDPFWQKCYPCQHKGVCCIRVEIYALNEEIRDIRELLESDPERRKLVADNLKEKKRCIFYSRQADECLVHAVRPMACRLNPFSCLVHDNKIDVFTTHCENGRISFGLEESEIISTDGRFITTKDRTYFNVQGIYEELGIPSDSEYMHVYFKRLLLEKKPGLIPTILTWMKSLGRKP